MTSAEAHARAALDPKVSEARIEGRAAFSDGLGLRDNPHAGDAAEEWSEGWYMARDAHEIAHPRRSTPAEIAAAATVDVSRFGKRRARSWGFR